MVTFNSARINVSYTLISGSLIIGFLILHSISCSLDPIEAPSPAGGCTGTVKIGDLTSPCESPCTLDINNASTNTSDFTFEWRINDTAVSTAVNLGSRSFSPGTHEITLIGTCTSDNSKQQDVVTIQVNQDMSQTKPTANFAIMDSTNNGFAPSTFCFTNTSENADTYAWEFGDPTSSDNQSPIENPCHLFENAGIYQVQLIAQNSSNGLADTAVVSITVNEVLTFMAEYGGGNDEVGYSVVETQSGDFAIAGYTESFTNGARDMYFLRVDELGNEVVSAKNFGGMRDEEALDLVEKEDGGFILVGYTESFSVPEGNDNEDGYIIVTDPNGNMQGNFKTIGNARGDELKAIKKATNGYAIAGFGRETGQGSASYLLSVLDENGFQITGFQANKYFGSQNENDVALDVLSTTEEFILIGYSFTYGGVGYMVRTTQNGQELSAPGSLTFSEVIELKSICEFQNGYAVLGNSEDNEIYIYFVDLMGNRTLNHIILSEAFNVEGKTIINVDDNRIAIAGNFTMSSFSQVYFVLYDVQAGQRINTEYHDGPDEASAYAEKMIQTRDGGFVIVGETRSFGDDDQVLLLKTNHLGQIK